MAKKRKHHSMRRKMHHLYDEADRMDRRMERGHMRIAHDRRGHSIGEHSGTGMGRQESSSQGYHARGGYDETFQERMNLNERRRIMETNNGSMAPIREDFRMPCGIPYGALTRDLGNGDYYSMNAYRVGDLYEQVDSTMREDAAAIKSITKPSNW